MFGGQTELLVMLGVILGVKREGLIWSRWQGGVR